MFDSFGYDTLLDVTVNLIPMGILVVFTAFFFVFSPFDSSPFLFFMTYLLMALPIVLLGILTYYAGDALGDPTGSSEPRPESNADRQRIGHSESDGETNRAGSGPGRR